jgi:hypothetical protein
MAARYWSTRFNIDGLLRHNSAGKVCKSYVQVFRSGSIEAVDSSLLTSFDSGKLFPYKRFAMELKRSLEGYLAALEAMLIDPPVFVMLSLLGVRGYYIPAPTGDMVEEFDRDDLLLPDVLVEERPIDLDLLVRPVLDTLWQASGWERCVLYTEQGKLQV